MEMYDLPPNSEEGSLSPAVERLIKRISQNCSRAKESDKAVQHFTEKRDDLINYLISDLRELQKLSFDDVKGPDEKSIRSFYKFVDETIDELIKRAILYADKTFQKEPSSPQTFEFINETIKDTASKLKGFKAYLANLQRDQLNRNFHLPDAKRNKN